MRYRSPDEDSGRWTGFAFRPGDIVISTRSKSGTTWLQMICALLVFQTPDLPAPLGELSPWLDWLVVPRDEVWAQLEAQSHRRFIKTHTPLDGVPIDERATYLVAARDPLDAAVSLYHQGDNLDRDRIAELTGATSPTEPPRRPSQHDWLVAWIDADVRPVDQLDSLPGVMWHLSDAWSRRHDPNIVLVRYRDLVDDLDGQMRHLSSVLGIAVDEGVWPSLVEAAGFTAMRERADQLAPDALGVLKDPTRFFRHGTPGDGRAVLAPAELARYRQRVADLAPPDLLAWLDG